MAITAALVKELRDKTGAGMMDCKAALLETSGDMEKAVDHLRKAGILKELRRVTFRPFPSKPKPATSSRSSSGPLPSWLWS